jgi:hypothetical protein
MQANRNPGRSGPSPPRLPQVRAILEQLRLARRCESVEVDRLGDEGGFPLEPEAKPP